MQNHTPSDSPARAITWFSSVTAGYSDSEDRMWLKLVSAEREVVVWATRRLIGALLSKAQTFLRGDQDEETWQTAHARAVAPFLDRGGDKPPARSESIKDHAQPVGLAYEIQLTRQNELNLFVFKTSQGQFGVPCSEAESHCLLELLHRRSESAGWGLLIRPAQAQSAAPAESPDQKSD